MTRSINELLRPINVKDLSVGDILRALAALREARDIVGCVADGLKREPRQLQADAIELLKKWDEHD